MSAGVWKVTLVTHGAEKSVNVSTITFKLLLVGISFELLKMLQNDKIKPKRNKFVAL